MIRKIQLVFIFLSLSTLQLSAQAVYDSLLTELNSKYPQEKLYIQTDKSFYNPGETVWLKAYIWSDNFATNISTNIYAELVDEKNNILKRKVMPVTQLGASFDFDIPDTTQKSRLYLRAYTTWMLNFDDIYSKAININQPGITAPAIAQHYSLVFFPEGGDLVAGLESKVAFKTNDVAGKPFSIKGNILSEEGLLVQSFESVHDGMGLFSFIPEAGKKYKAVWEDPSGKSHETVVPDSRTIAATLSIDQKNKGLNYTIRRSADATDELKEFVIVGQMNQRIIYAARINLKTKTTITAAVNVDSLSEGIIQFTLFNKAQQPVAERIFYLNGIPNRFETNAKLVTKNFLPRGKNEIQVDISNEFNSNISIAVIDDNMSPSAHNASNIVSQFLMSSDLRGYVHNPGYYFLSDADSVKQHLDLVMLTNGWRRFKWEDLLAGRWPQIKFMPENYLSVEGKINGLSASELKDRFITGFLQSGKDNRTGSYITLHPNKDGFFRADKFYFSDSVKIFYQLSNDKSKKLLNKARFSFKTNFPESPKSNMPVSLQYAQLPAAIAIENVNDFKLYRQEEADNQRRKLMDNVTVQAKYKSADQKADEAYSTGAFASGQSTIFLLENDPLSFSFRTVFDYLQGKVPGLQLDMSDVDTTISRRNHETYLFIDEIESPMEHFLSVPLSDVALIKVFDPPFVGAPRSGWGGAIAVYLKKASYSTSRTEGLHIASLVGYAAGREFYSPDYEMTGGNITDLRTTLYWNPRILLNNKSNTITIPFFNNSKAKKIRVVLEGINEKGQVTYTEKIFE